MAVQMSRGDEILFNSSIKYHFSSIIVQTVLTAIQLIAYDHEIIPMICGLPIALKMPVLNAWIRTFPEALLDADDLIRHYKIDALFGMLPNGIDIIIYDKGIGWVGDGDGDYDGWRVETGVLDPKAIFQPASSTLAVDYQVFYEGESYNGASLKDLCKALGL
jgi:hypothetical protein